MFYAQLDGSDICVSVTQTAAPISHNLMIPIPTLSETYLGMHYNRSNGQWTEV